MPCGVLGWRLLTKAWRSGEAKRADLDPAFATAAEIHHILDLAGAAILGVDLADGNAQRLGPQHEGRARAEIGQPDRQGLGGERAPAAIHRLDAAQRQL